MVKKIIIGIVVLALIGWVAFTLIKNKKEIDRKNVTVDRSAFAVPVAVSKAFIANVEGDFILPAVTEANTETDVIVSAQGKLIELNIELGSFVTKGQVLGRIDTKLQDLNLSATKLSEDKLQKDYQRYGDLYKGNAVTEVNYNDIKYNYENIKIQTNQIKQQIANATIIAPLSGTIVRKSLEVGEFVNPGTPIATIVDVSKLKATVLVSEKDVYKLSKGMVVGISSDIYPSKTFKGTIRYISPKGDDSHNYPIEIAIDNDSKFVLKAGTFVRANFQLQGSAKALQIPKIALVEGIKNPYVYVINGKKAARKKLILGREIGENVEIIDGLNEGDEVITGGQINLSEGSLVELVKK